MSNRKGATSELSGGGTSGALMTMVILGAAAACVSIPSAAVFLVNKLTRHQTPRIRRGRKLKARQPGASSPLQSVVGSTASDDEKEPLESQHQQIDQPPAAEERVAEVPLSLGDVPEDKALDDRHEGHQDKMETSDRKQKTRQPGATNQSQSVVGSTASDDANETFKSESRRMLDQFLEFLARDSSDNEIDFVIDSPDPRQQEPTVSELTPEKEKEKINTVAVGEEGDTTSRSSGYITDYPYPLEKLGQGYVLVGEQNVKLVQRIKMSYPQEVKSVHKWEYTHEDEVSSSLYSDDQGNESEVSSTNQNNNNNNKEGEGKSLTQDQSALSVETSRQAEDNKEEENQHGDDNFVSPVSSQSISEAAQEITLGTDTIESAVAAADGISIDNEKKATDDNANGDDLKAMMATTLRTLAKMSPTTTTTGSLSIVDDEEEYSAPSSSPSVWYSILKWMQLLFIVMLKVMVIFLLLAVSVKIAERYEDWPRVMNVPPSFQMTTGSGGDGGNGVVNAQRCDADDLVCLLLQRHGF